jgi:hypothetical protein
MQPKIESYRLIAFMMSGIRYHNPVAILSLTYKTALPTFLQDSPADFVPCFVAFETNVRKYAGLHDAVIHNGLAHVTIAKECR